MFIGTPSKLYRRWRSIRRKRGRGVFAVRRRDGNARLHPRAALETVCAALLRGAGVNDDAARAVLAAL